MLRVGAKVAPAFFMPAKRREDGLPALKIVSIP